MVDMDWRVRLFTGFCQELMEFSQKKAWQLDTMVEPFWMYRSNQSQQNPGARTIDTICTLYLFPGGVCDDPPVDVADAHRAHGPVPRYVRGGEGGRGSVDRHHVGVSHRGGVHGEKVADELRLQAEALGARLPDGKI